MSKVKDLMKSKQQGSKPKSWVKSTTCKCNCNSCNQTKKMNKKCNCSCPNCKRKS